jgi:hypothetical protein
MHINAHFIYLFYYCCMVDKKAVCPFIYENACVWILSVICSSQYCSGPVDFLMLRVGLL